VIGVVELESSARIYIRQYEEIKNHGVHEVLRRKHVLCFIHNSDFRIPAGPLTLTNQAGEIYFP
jgi:hypothetical protein